MAGVLSAAPTTGVINGPKLSYDVVGSTSQENTIANKGRPFGPRQNSTGSSRMPLSNLAPNRKDSSGTGRLTHSRVEELGQSETKLARSGSEPDSLLDLYRGNQSSGNVSQQGNDNDNDIPENMYHPEDYDPEGWIHRDKLAKIENEELQVAGINLASARRNVNKTVSRETSRGQRSEDRRTDLEGAKPRLAEPVQEEDEQANWDFRTPDEIEADAATSQMYTHPVLRKSGSKIPILTSSPLPIPQERIERDTPLVRRRTISDSMSPEEGIPVFKARRRKGSTGSSPLRDEPDIASPTRMPTNGSKGATPKPASPTSSRPPQTSQPTTSTGRKISGNLGSRKSPANSKSSTTASPSQRPGTRSGELDRPRTAVNRPEGDAPWLATMYKPDPMLPPDQQIIPTHARRQQQAQWQDQGAIPSTYDRDFSPLAIHTGNGFVKEASPNLPSSPSPDRDRDDTSWPLKPVPSVRNSVNGRPGTGGSTNGGYSTMPRVTSPAIMQSPRMGNISSSPGLPNRVQVQRLEPDDMEEKSKQKGCGCCVVM